jgi:hypothetical protein
MFRDFTVASMAFLTPVDLSAAQASPPRRPNAWPNRHQSEKPMFSTLQRVAGAALVTLAFTLPAQAADNGVVRVKSAYSMDESIARVKADVAAKGITFFNEIDQSAPAYWEATRQVHQQLVDLVRAPLPSRAESVGLGAH